MQCPLSYYLGRVRKLPRSQAAWFVQGTAVHEAVSFWELSERAAPAEEVLQTYEKSWTTAEDEAWSAQPDAGAWQRSGTKKVEKDLEDRHVRGKGQVEAYLEYAKTDPLEVWRLPDTGKPASEFGFEIEFGGVPVRGFIDLIMVDPKTGELLVRDIKTGIKKPVGSFQLATYRHAVHKQYGVDPKWGDYWMAKDGKPTTALTLAPATEALITAQYQIMDYSQNAGLYGANIGDHCGRCDVARHCPFVGGTAPEGVPALGT